MNPTFSSSKLRELNPLLLTCVDRMIEILSKKSSTDVNVTETMKKFTMDSIWQCAFGIDADTQNKTNDPYFEKSEKVLKELESDSFWTFIYTTFHEFQDEIFIIFLILNGLKQLIMKNSVFTFFWLRNEILNIYNLRKNNPQVKKKDYVQILLETQLDNSNTYKSQESALDVANMHFEKKMTTDEISSNLAVFLIAGYETTSATLTNALYMFAKYPEEQAKLRNEIMENLPSDEPNLDNVQNLHYLDMVIKEVLRMCPITTITRRCIAPTVINEIEFSKNMVITIDGLSISYDPELWGPVDPYVFHPERFATDNYRHSLAYLGFGHGPRHCIGMKFALLELKLALVKILRKFTIRPSEKTVEKLVFKEGLVRGSAEMIQLQFDKIN